MKIIEKATKNVYAACSVLGGYQVCKIPGMEWHEATNADVKVILNEEFDARFEVER